MSRTRDGWPWRLPERPLLLSVLIVSFCLQIRLSAEQWTNSEITASFYGDSHLWLALQDASSATELTVNFRTHQRDAIIFLAAGETDYCLVELRNGRLRVRVNLGSGESVLQSPRGLRLDDYVWHTVQLSRRNAQATLTVDRQYVSHLIIPGVFYQLNIIYGVYLGGLGQFRDLFLGNFVQFRGCLKNVKFNTIEANRVRNWDILRTAYLNQSSSADSALHHIRWECDDEFSAKNHDPISFVQPDNFLTFPTLQIRQNGTIELEVKTVATEGILLYNGGSPSQPDFLALDIIQGKIRLQVEKGNGPLLLQSDRKINDGHWHNISCQVTTGHTQLSVDGFLVTFSPRSSMKRYLDLDGSLYVGGVEANRKLRVRQQGLHDRSFLGCVKDLRVNDVDLGFEKIVVSNGIEPHCVWDYPCAREPCIPTAMCQQIGLDSFRCECSEEKCEKDREDMIDWTQVLRINNFTVKEAGQHIVSQENIRVIWNYQGESIRDSQIVFQVQRPPRYGRLEVNLLPRNKENSFTYLDILSERVLYIHDGSERPLDHFDLTIQIPTTMGNLTRSFPMSVTVNPENDPPKIVFPNGPQIEIVPGTARTLTADVMRAVDPDSSASALVFSILVPLKVSLFRSTPIAADGQTTGVGGTPQQPPLMKQFTQADIDAGLVEIYFNGSLTDQDQVIFSITDGVHSGKEKATISIIPLKLNIHVVTNKSINVPINSSSLITQNNLSFATNAIHQNLTILYVVIHQPTFGRLELHNNTQWIPTDNFTQDDINTLAVRYVHLHDVPSRDAFRVRLSVLPVTGSGAGLSSKDQTHLVQVRFLGNKLKTIHLEPLVFHTPHVIVSSMSLLHEQEPMPLAGDEVRYSLKNPPRQGVMQRGGTRLKRNDNFTQADINSGLIVFSLSASQNLEIPSRDYAIFDVTARHLQAGLTARRLVLKYEPVRSSWVLRDAVLKVKEGGNAALNNDVLTIQYGGVNQTCNFALVTFPAHGILQTRDQRNVTEFSTQDVQEKLVFYTHDNSETETDAVELMASCNGRQRKLQFPLLINISLINTHRPIPVRLGPVFLVQNASRLLTGGDIYLTDLDANSLPGSLQLAHRGLLNADIFHLSDRHSPIFQCIQSDIAQGHIVIKHRGALQAASTVYISDGELFSTEKLTIQAEPLVLTAKDVLMIPLQPDTSTVEFTLRDLNFQTNADIRWNPVTLTIPKGPKFATAFVRNQSVHYRRKEDLAVEATLDSFVVQFAVNNATVQTNISLVSVKPMKIQRIEPILVKENSAAQITAQTLNVTHPVWDPTKLTFTIEKAPLYGHLSVGPAASVEMFTQEDVNLGRFKYVNRFESPSFRDQFVVRVEAPFAMENLTATVDIFIVPEVLRLNAQKPIKVIEGKQAEIKLRELLKAIPNAEVLPLKLQIKDKPSHGKAFVNKDGDINYSHDGSETTTDVFTLFVSLDRLSIKTTEEIRLEIVPLNDNPPQLIIKNPLDVWLGSQGYITPNNFEIIDEDSDANNSAVVFHVNTSNANILMDSKRAPIFTFPEVVQNRIRYQPSGSANLSSISFFATDGKLVSEISSLPIRILDVKLFVQRNESIEVGRNSSLIITTDELDVGARKISVWDKQDLGPVAFKPTDLLFSVTHEPFLGYVGLFQNTDGIGELIRATSWTQKDLIDGRVGYMQAVPITDSQIVDFFQFDVTLKNPQERRLGNLIFFINVKSSDASIRSHPLLVPFGRSVLVKRLHLDATRFLPRGEWKRIRYSLGTAPKLGSFYLDATQLKSGASFTQTDINKQRLSYQHLGKESQTPTEEVNLRLTMPEKKSMTVTLNITILESDSHLRVHVKDSDVVSGENLTLSSDVLRTNLDNNPARIIRYRVFKELRGGMFRVRDAPSKEFTQRDVLDGAVMFAHDGSNDPRTIPIQLEVLPIDEAAMSELVQFNIHVIPFFFRLDHLANITLIQGNFSIPINSTYISIASNADKSRILYNVTQEPKNGKLRHLNTSRPGSIRTFTQLDIDKGRILYEQTNLEESKDHFSMDIMLTKRDEALSMRNKTIFVNVVPLLKLDPPIVPIGHTISLNPAYLDASALKNRSSAEPTFRITRGPKLGSLAWTTPGKTGPVNSFTQTDLVDKKVTYKAPAEMATRDAVVTDSFEFILTASSDVQVTQGTFPIKIRNLHQQPTRIVTNDIVLIALVVAGTVLAAMVFFFILYWRYRKRQRNRKRSVSQHAHLSPLFHPKGRTGDSPDEALTAPSTVPNCKVIPLRKPGKNFRSPETELHHLDAYREDLYGSAGMNGYVSRSETTPVLSKNQYWV